MENTIQMNLFLSHELFKDACLNVFTFQMVNAGVSSITANKKKIKIQIFEIT